MDQIFKIYFFLVEFFFHKIPVIKRIFNQFLFDCVKPPKLKSKPENNDEQMHSFPTCIAHRECTFYSEQSKESRLLASKLLVYS